MLQRTDSIINPIFFAIIAPFAFNPGAAIWLHHSGWTYQFAATWLVGSLATFAVFMAFKFDTRQMK